MPKPFAALIKRERKFSGKPEDDENIVFCVRDTLESYDFNVRIYEPKEFLEATKIGYTCDLIASMARGAEINSTLALLQAQRGIYVVNAPEAISASLSKYYTYKRLEYNGIRIPEYTLQSVNCFDSKYDKNLGKIIVKAAHGHDLWFVVEKDFQFKSCIDTYISRRCEEIIVQRFIEGMHIKYYGIGNKIILPPICNSFDSSFQQDILTMISNVRKVCGLEVFGGDLIGNPSSHDLYCLDVNDWPSFGAVSEYSQKQAGQDIGQYIHKRYLEKVGRKS